MTFRRRQIGTTLLAGAALAAAAAGAGQPEPLANPVYVDEWSTATETFQGLPALLASRNLDGAVRVLQRLLDEGPDRVVASEQDPDLFVSVRARVHRLLLSDPVLMARYREVEGPRAAHRLAEPGGAAEVERSRLFTAAGFEAALRVAQAHADAARFNAAYFTLRQLEDHPDRNGAAAGEAAAMLASLARFLDRPDVRALAERWARQHLQPVPDLSPLPWPPLAARRGLSPFEPAPPVVLAGMVARPLWTVTMTTATPPETSARAGPGNPQPGEQAPAGARWLWIMPTVAGDAVFANDGTTVWAWDRFTLSRRWSVTPAPDPRAVGPTDASAALDPRRNRVIRYRGPGGPSIEDASTVAVAGRDLVAVTGVVLAGDGRRDLEAVHLIDTDTGRLRWSVRIEDLDPALLDASVRGAPMIADGTVVLAARRISTAQRLASLHLLGLDVATGRLKWRRLIGSAGALPYAQIVGQVDGGACADGVVYRLDQLGVIGACEAESGRPLWVRRADGPASFTQAAVRPWDACVPIIDGEAIVTISPDRRAVLRLDRATGRVLGSRPAADFSTPTPDYLVRAGDTLAAVSATRVALVPIAEFDRPGTPIRQVQRITDPGIRGRVVAAGTRLIVPTAAGVAVLDTQDAGGRLEPIPLEKPGNVLALPSQIIVADDTRLHSYLLWDEAERVLLGRMRADPADPGPAVTFAELAYRAGQPSRILGAVDTAIAAIAGAGAAADASRDRLFQALLTMVNASQEPDARPPAEGSGLPSGRLADAALVASLIDRLGRLAGTPDQRAAHLLALGRSGESRGEWRRAVESYQSLLDDPALLAATFTGPQVSVRAELEATWRLERLIQERGPAIYAPFESRARAELDALGPGASIESLEALVRRYPVASAVPGVWGRIASLHEAAERPQAAAAALESGLRAAARRPDTDPAVAGLLGGRLVRSLEQRGQVSAAAAALRQWRDRFPGATLADQSGALDADAILASLAQRVAELSRWPRIGPILADGAQAIPGWSLMRPMRRDADPAVWPCLPLESGDEVALWACPPTTVPAGRQDSASAAAPAACPGELVKVWSAPTSGAEVYLMGARGETVYFLFDSPAGGAITAASASRGMTLWKSEPFPALFLPDSSPAAPGLGPSVRARAAEPPAIFQTPLDGAVSGAALLWCMDDRTVVLVERAGRAAAFDAQTGQVLWAVRTPVSRVFDADARDGMVVVAGEQDPPPDAAGASGPVPVLAVLEARTGRLAQRLAPAGAVVRWVTLAPAGALLVGTDRAVASIDLSRGQTTWVTSEPVLANSQQAWVAGDRLFVTTGENSIRTMWSLSLRDGRTGPRPAEIPSEHMDASQPIYAAAVVRPAGAAEAGAVRGVAFTTMHGVAILSPAGELVGRDALGAVDAMVPAQPAEGALVAAETTAASREPDGQMGFAVHVLDDATARVVQSVRVVLGARPRRLALMDGRVAITAGGATVVLRAPAPPPARP